MHLTFVVGARPNFMKVAPIMEVARDRPQIVSHLVHTGQHYDERMSALFFRELALPEPDVYLGVGSGSHAVQTGRVMIAFDEALDQTATDMVVVVGDVNSTLACSLVAVKRGIKVAHVEAGLRSGDRSMPEEINRILTDQISDLLFTTERSASDNLRAEGIPDERIRFVGNVMIDTLMRHRESARSSDILNRLAQKPRGYAVCTLHRPSNVDTLAAVENTTRAIRILSDRMPVVFPMHPRTRAKLQELGGWDAIADMESVSIVEPLGYLDFLALTDNAAVVFTDSGGIQEETTALGVPCITFRDSTERPITVSQGTNRLIGLDPSRLESALADLSAGRWKSSQVPEGWDGKAAERILDELVRWHESNRIGVHRDSQSPLAANVKQ